MPVIGVWEVAVILLIALFVFGPKKLPEMARALGEATREFRRASSEVEREVQKISSDVERDLQTISSGVQQKAVEPVKNEKALLSKIAGELGIEVEGKTPEQLSEDIVKKIAEGKEAKVKEASS